MSWFLRAVEQPDGEWLCRFGHQEFGRMPDKASALRHLAAAASDLGGRHLFHFYLHGLDGSVQTVPGTDRSPASEPGYRRGSGRPPVVRQAAAARA